MAVETLYKQPTESRVYTMDFSPNMVTGETISSVTSFTVSPSGLTSNTATPNGQEVNFRLSGGTANTQYKITCVVATSLGNTLEMEGYLLVEDK